MAIPLVDWRRTLDSIVYEGIRKHGYPPPAARDQAGWNCCSSFDPFSAVVDDWPCSMALDNGVEIAGADFALMLDDREATLCGGELSFRSSTKAIPWCANASPPHLSDIARPMPDSRQPE